MSEIPLSQLLKTVTHFNASDLHLIVNSEPKIRIDGGLEPLDIPILSGALLQTLLYSILTDSQKKRFEEQKELDFAFEMADIGRFRANYYAERGNIAAAFRIIPSIIPTMAELNFPPILKELTLKEKGLVLVTGPTGSGKSTTMASMIDAINETQNRHIITIEDPVEFLHTHKKSLLSQRNVGEDTQSFATALKYSLRQDPDIIYVGEMRDVETIRAALTAAETGHLVFGTLHTNSAAQTLSRIINVFPSDEQSMVRTQLSMNLMGVVSQVLIPKIGGGRVAIQEIMTNTPAISNLIREEKQHQIYAQMQLNQQHTKMQTQAQEIIRAFRERLITQDHAVQYASNLEEVKRAIGVI